MEKYIYQYPNWPEFFWDEKATKTLFGQVRNFQGRISGQMNTVGFVAKEERALTTLTLDVVKSSEIEGEILNYEQVRSSIARHLGINTAGLVASPRHVEGVVEMMLDATQNYQKPLTHERLHAWHASLFPTGFSGLYKIEAGCYRTGKMQVVSGALGNEKVHYEAIAPEQVQSEMESFLYWFNCDDNMDQVIKAAIAHFWFIIIHPFDDGNGRIARALTDLLLARSEQSQERFYSMSNQMLIERKRYYEVLQIAQHSTGDISIWFDWFLNCLKSTLCEAEKSMTKILSKAEFWKTHENTVVNERQRFMLNKLLEDFVGKLQTSKWAKMTKCSSDTALRDIKDLVEKGILQAEKDSGRSASYALKSM